MNETVCNNRAVLIGCMTGRPVFSHEGRGIRYMTFPLTVSRLSGVEDTVNVVCREELLTSTQVTEQQCIEVAGELRTHNNRSGVGSRLLVYIYALSIMTTDAPPENQIFLRGTVCKRPVYRITPLGREICDLHAAVNRPGGQSDYIPCICWGKNALASSVFEVGTGVELTGRIQSRQYTKQTETGEEKRTAFELSVTTIDEL